jgi:hypothetical protein
MFCLASKEKVVCTPWYLHHYIGQAETGIRTHQTTDWPSIHTRYGHVRRIGPDFIDTSRVWRLLFSLIFSLIWGVLAVSLRQRWGGGPKCGARCRSGAPPPEDTRPPSAPPPAASSSEPSPCRATSISVLKKGRRRESRARTGDQRGRGGSI